MPEPIDLRPQGGLGRFFDHLLEPLMFMLQGNGRGVPQRTHRWNNHHFTGDFGWLDGGSGYRSVGDDTVLPGVLDPLTMHAPLLGGRRSLLVFDRKEYEPEPWFVGWSWKENQLGVSRIPLFGPVRVTVGRGQCWYFGFRTDGTQVPIRLIARSTVNDPRPFERAPLL